MNPNWRDSAACIGLPIDVFFDEHYADSRTRWAVARAICASCPVVDDCLIAALTEEPSSLSHGYRGGMSPSRRRVKASALKLKYGIVNQPAPIEHGTHYGYGRCRRDQNGACLACKEAHARRNNPEQRPRTGPLDPPVNQMRRVAS